MCAEIPTPAVARMTDSCAQLAGRQSRAQSSLVPTVVEGRHAQAKLRAIAVSRQLFVVVGVGDLRHLSQAHLAVLGYLPGVRAAEKRRETGVTGDQPL
jgi:hypothetical protein